jgi:hypothetical protein
MNILQKSSVNNSYETTQEPIRDKDSPEVPQSKAVVRESCFRDYRSE